MSELERCWICGDPTGRAGRADDSIFDEADGGPYCPGCWDSVHEAAPDLYARVAYHAANCRACNGAKVITSACGTRSAPCPTCSLDRAALAKARGEAT